MILKYILLYLDYLACLLLATEWIFTPNESNQDHAQISVFFVDLLHLHQHRSLHTRRPNGDGLNLITSSYFQFLSNRFPTEGWEIGSGFYLAAAVIGGGSERRFLVRC